jgi:hypothetical protein
MSRLKLKSEVSSSSEAGQQPPGGGVTRSMSRSSSVASNNSEGPPQAARYGSSFDSDSSSVNYTSGNEGPAKRSSK